MEKLLSYLDDNIFTTKRHAVIIFLCYINKTSNDTARLGITIRKHLLRDYRHFCSCQQDAKHVETKKDL